MSQDLAPYRDQLPAKPEIITPPRLPPAPPLGRELRFPARFGFLLGILFFGVGGVWASTARLSGAVIAAGYVSAESTRQTVQHLEGGIIREIRVREGDKVVAGQEIVVMEDLMADADITALRKRMLSLMADETRLEAERANAGALVFKNPLFSDLNDPVVREIVDQQISLFESRRNAHFSRRDIMTKRLAQLHPQVKGYESQIAAVRKQKVLFNDEVAVVEDLVTRGYEKLPRLNALKRSQADRDAAEAEAHAQLGRVRETIAETELQLVNLDIERREKIDDQLSDTRVKRADAEEQYRKVADRLKRTVIKSPITGIVLKQYFKTPGGVVGPAQPIFDIVPTEENLIIDARISPRDVDDVHVGMLGYVIFPSYPQRNLFRVHGKVDRMSPDTLQDERNGERYFSARFEVDREELKKLAPGIELMPGLPAEVYIATIDRTVIEYLMQPLLMTIERSMRER